MQGSSSYMKNIGMLIGTTVIQPKTLIKKNTYPPPFFWAKPKISFKRNGFLFLSLYAKESLLVAFLCFPVKCNDHTTNLWNEVTWESYKREQFCSWFPARAGAVAKRRKHNVPKYSPGIQSQRFPRKTETLGLSSEAEITSIIFLTTCKYHIFYRGVVLKYRIFRGHDTIHTRLDESWLTAVIAHEYAKFGNHSKLPNIIKLILSMAKFAITEKPFHFILKKVKSN